MGTYKITKKDTSMENHDQRCDFRWGDGPCNCQLSRHGNGNKARIHGEHMCNASISIKVSQHIAWKEAAARCGLTLSQFIRLAGDYYLDASRQDTGQGGEVKRLASVSSDPSSRSR